MAEAPESSKQTKNQKEMMYDLEMLKTLRPKIRQLQNLHAKLQHEIDCFKAEKEHAQEVNRELCILQNERRLHEDAIRDISEDTKKLEKISLQNKREQDSIRTRAMEFIEEMGPLKRDVDVIRASLGMDELPELDGVKIFQT